MNNHRSTITNQLSNQKGQVALFVALIFQVLFVFFAMIVNVGLLVHHKINLQNSVDLAAYYGATKQAEMMNAIGHVNYQIRQSWKLLNFRYNQLGSAGAIGTSPNYAPYTPNPSPGRIQFEDDGPYGGAANASPIFCIPYAPVKGIIDVTENYCLNLAAQNIPLPQTPAGVSGLGAVLFGNLYSAMATAAAQMRNQAQKGCERVFAVNWMTLATYIQLYKMDIRNRKQLLFALANRLSKPDPTDIDGESIRQGVYKTLLKNLTMQSQESLKSAFGESGQGTGGEKVQFEYLNSLTGSECGEGASEIEPPKWLSEIFVFPFYVAADAKCNGSSFLEFSASFFNTGSNVLIPENVMRFYTGQAGMGMSTLEQIRDYVTEFGTSNPTVQMYRTSLGVEKNPWCVAYSGVAAKVTPKIPFSPLGDVTLTAKAFAKPFGGRIGPWYSRLWPQNSKSSDMNQVLNPSQLVDRLLPIRVNPTTNVNVNPQQYASQRRIYPNHSRYLGDEIGVTSNLTMSQFGKAIHAQAGPIGINLGWTEHTFDENFDQPNNGNGDPLMWDKVANTAPPLRNIEIAAVAPDQFDISTYSIDPDFYNNYLRRIEKGYGSQFNFMLRGDLGSRMKGSDEEKRFSIRNQIEINAGLKPGGVIDTASKLTYYLNKIGQVLTGWQQTSPDSYIFPTDKFAKCGVNQDDPMFLVKQDDQENLYTSGSCKAGGRTGYSVKLVDGKFLANEVNGSGKSYELGGPGVTGNILNPPSQLNPAF